MRDPTDICDKPDKHNTLYITSLTSRRVSRRSCSFGRLPLREHDQDMMHGVNEIASCSAHWPESSEMMASGQVRTSRWCGSVGPPGGCGPLSLGNGKASQAMAECVCVCVSVRQAVAGQSTGRRVRVRQANRATRSTLVVSRLTQSTLRVSIR